MIPRTVTLPDGRVVELIDMTLVERIGDQWIIDVHLRVDEAVVTKRIDLEWTP